MARFGFDPRYGQAGLVTSELVLEQLFSECFGFPGQFSFQRPFDIRLLWLTTASGRL
jgi:hypothetical protein